MDISTTEDVDVVVAEAADTKTEASTMEAVATTTMQPLISIISNNINQIRVQRTALCPLKTIMPPMQTILITAPIWKMGVETTLTINMGWLCGASYKSNYYGSTRRLRELLQQQFRRSRGLGNKGTEIPEESFLQIKTKVEQDLSSIILLAVRQIQGVYLQRTLSVLCDIGSTSTMVNKTIFPFGVQGVQGIP